MTAQPHSRFALLSDIHANLYALESVLSEIAALRIEQIFCLGDVVTLGPVPSQVLSLIRTNCSGFILGNHDEYIVVDSRITDRVRDPSVRAAIDWCREQLAPEEITFLKSFSATQIVDLGLGRRALLYQGSPLSNHVETIDDSIALTLSQIKLDANRLAEQAKNWQTPLAPYLVSQYQRANPDRDSSSRGVLGCDDFLVNPPNLTVWGQPWGCHFRWVSAEK